MHFGVSTLSLEHCSTGKRKMETDCQCKGPLWAGLRPQPFSLSQCSGAHTLLSKDYLWSIHHPSTCNQLMEPLTISPTVKKKKKGRERKRKKMQTFHITDGTETMFCFTVISHYSCLHESDSGCGCGEACGCGGTRGRGLLKNPFTQPGVVTWIQWDRGEGHGTLK